MALGFEGRATGNNIKIPLVFFGVSSAAADSEIFAETLFAALRICEVNP